MSNLSLNPAVLINDPGYGERFARVKVPSKIRRGSFSCTNWRR
ncbi:MAG: hypothetical protein IPH87_27805 [Anaerolineae bacterium]|nr:hypothetical protein [Anaerolineae bacterium]